MTTNNTERCSVCNKEIEGPFWECHCTEKFPATNTKQQDAISDDFLQWIEETRPHDTELDFTPSEAAWQNGYIAGAKAAYRKLTETKAPVLRWVKASERLPDDGMIHPARYIFSDESIDYSTMTVGENELYIGEGSIWPKVSLASEPLQYWEWLEEINH